MQYNIIRNQTTSKQGIKTINLAKALKVKARLATELKNILTLIEKENVYTTSPKADASVLLKEAADLRERLINIKLKINRANYGILEKMIRKDELKAMIMFYKELSTDETTLVDYRTNTMINKQVQIDSMCVVNTCKEIQRQIDLLQDEIDEYNGRTFIDED